jgi:hypothetical protein
VFPSWARIWIFSTLTSSLHQHHSLSAVYQKKQRTLPWLQKLARQGWTCFHLSYLKNSGSRWSEEVRETHIPLYRRVAKRGVIVTNVRKSAFLQLVVFGSFAARLAIQNRHISLYSPPLLSSPSSQSTACCFPKAANQKQAYPKALSKCHMRVGDLFSSKTSLSTFMV